MGPGAESLVFSSILGGAAQEGGTVMGPSVARRTVAALALIGIALLMGARPASPADPKPQTFVFVQGTEYDNLDPHAIFDQSRVASRLNLYDSLYRWQDNPPKLN